MTDSRHYAHLSPNGALRWTPGTFSKAGGELNRIHGTNERILTRDFACGLLTSQQGQQQQQQQQQLQQQQQEL
ncbi:hypothetical protein COO60DRAFT_1647466 [Scenedesmus sp. NREL 46B-D3]|nr:hypothetical protein COO60DRAFT_1647466 [Scenedesmus sp. NREL 46B-D3]